MGVCAGECVGLYAGVGRGVCEGVCAGVCAGVYGSVWNGCAGVWVDVSCLCVRVSACVGVRRVCESMGCVCG